MQTPTTSRDSGFTLVELMVTIVIATVLMSIAIPSYTAQIRKSKRTDAKTALLDLAGREERYMATNSAYTDDASFLGYGPLGTPWPVTLPNGDYQLPQPVVTSGNPAGTPPTPPTYTLTATTYGTQTQDTSCATFTLTNLGVRTATSTSCW